MLERKVKQERRQDKRFKAAEGAFAALMDPGGKLGQIKDISTRGISFLYIGKDDEPTVTNHLKIILGGSGLYMDNVPIKKIADFEVESEYSFSTIKMRQIGLQFCDLTPEQKHRLQDFIENHTIGEV
jgi:hypothetical protein